MVRIRLQRKGRKNLAFYRIGVFDSRTGPRGKCLEILGHYDPILAKKEDRFVVKADRVKHWIEKGAKPTNTVAQHLKKKNIID